MCIQSVCFVYLGPSDECGARGSLVSCDIAPVAGHALTAPMDPGDACHVYAYHPVVPQQSTAYYATPAPIDPSTAASVPELASLRQST